MYEKKQKRTMSGPKEIFIKVLTLDSWLLHKERNNNVIIS